MKFRISQPQAIHQLGSRPNQEDSIFPVLNAATTADRLFILCDGMGGHESGEIASGTVCKTMSDYILSRLPADGVLEDQLFEEALTAAYAAINAQDNTGQKKMGTTLTFLCFHKGGCTVAHIGDSRIYHFRPSTNEILYRSRDHSLVYDLFEVGELTFEEMKTANNKNVITRVIMANQERPSRADIVHITNIKPGDYFYLCSDGMLEQMDDDDLLEIFGSDKSDDEKRKILTGETIDNSDNHSAYFIHIESVESEVGDDMFPNDEASARAANKVLLAERDPQSVPTLMPPPPPAPEMNEAPQSIGNIGDDDVQVVVGQPVEQQPQIHYQQPMPAPKQGNNSMMKWGVIGFLAVAVIAAAIAAVILFFGGKDEKPTRQDMPEIVNPPSKPSRPTSTYSEDEPVSSPVKPQTTTTPNNRRNNLPQTNSNANTNSSNTRARIRDVANGGKHDSGGKVNSNSNSNGGNSSTNPNTNVGGNTGNGGEFNPTPNKDQED